MVNKYVLIGGMAVLEFAAVCTTWNDKTSNEKGFRLC